MRNATLPCTPGELYQGCIYIGEYLLDGQRYGLLLAPIPQGAQEYTGHECWRNVIYMTDFGMQPGYVCLGISSDFDSGEQQGWPESEAAMIGATPEEFDAMADTAKEGKA